MKLSSRNKVNGGKMTRALDEFHPEETLVIDGDILFHKASYLSSDVIDWEDGTEPELIQHEEQALQMIYELVNTITTEVLYRRDDDVNCVIFAVSCPSGKYFRHGLYPDYKSNRKNTTLPYKSLLDTLKETMHNIGNKNRIRYISELLGIPVFVMFVRHLEADDIMGIYGSYGSVIATIDKDLKQVPCHCYNWYKRTFEKPSEDEADFFFYKQILKGDPTDGFGGCKGIGEKRADKILRPYFGNPVGLWSAVVQTFLDKDHSTNDAIRNARMAFILRSQENLDGQVVLWNPPE